MKQPLTIAIVDDEASVRKALGRLLSASEMNIKTFESGREFLDSLVGAKPDCVILDMHMPGMNGHEVQCALKAAAVTVPVIIITGFDEPENQVKCMAAGACAYLLKPLDGQVLLTAVEKCVHGSSSCTDHSRAPRLFDNRN